MARQAPTVPLLAEENGLQVPPTAQRLANARRAFEEGNVAGSIVAHSVANEAHHVGGEYLKDSVRSGSEGLLVALAVLAAARGADVSQSVVISIGVACVTAAAVAVSVAGALDKKAHDEFVLKERRREAWELENNPEGEVAEVVSIFVDKGMDRGDAEKAVRLMAPYKEFFTDLMMAMELEMQVPAEDENRSTEGVIAFVSFSLCGLMPFFVFILTKSSDQSLTHQFQASGAVALTLLCLLGAVKKCLTAQNIARGVFEAALCGGLTATAAHTVSSLVVGRF
mmetsp:Transcript_35106/g.76851  ORF Transcript_35106/g.76851 Transcript_35106/m.76851 type:complete len:282 (+) Transcript_35106:73-918(+)